MQTDFDYYLFYKPYQVLSQFSEEGDKKTLREFFPGIKQDVYPVGRLDYDSEGLLLLTNDKKLNHQLLNPLFVHEREYWVQVEGLVTNDAIKKISSGLKININGKLYKTKPTKIFALEMPVSISEREPPIRFRKNIPTSWLSITLTEGKNRQVRRMTAAAGFPTLRLIRYRMGDSTIENLQPGMFIHTGQNVRASLFTRKYFL